MEIYILLGAAIAITCGALYYSLRRLSRLLSADKTQPLLGVVAPQKPQDGSESIKTVRKVK